MDAVAWWVNNSGGNSKPAGTKLANELGIFDMSGNVAEWCFDAAGDMLHRTRGGSYNFGGPINITVYLRGGGHTTTVDNQLGFRLARNLGPKIVINGTLPSATLD